MENKSIDDILSQVRTNIGEIEEFIDESHTHLTVGYAIKGLIEVYNRLKKKK